jgi:hypothetical protein
VHTLPCAQHPPAAHALTLPLRPLRPAVPRRR